MKSRIQKWGNSLALRIPKSFATEINLKQDSWVQLSLIEGKLIIMAVKEQNFSLEELLAKVTDKNIHHEVDTGMAVGEEIW
jgi:antitoxin MazE